MSNYAVTLNYNCHYGYVEYNEADKTAVVTLPEAVAEAKAAVEKYLATPLSLDVPQGDTIRDFATITLEPLSSKEAFQVALTRLWGKTGVRVEWNTKPLIVRCVFIMSAANMLWLKLQLKKAGLTKNVSLWKPCWASNVPVPK